MLGGREAEREMGGYQITLRHLNMGYDMDLDRLLILSK